VTISTIETSSIMDQFERLERTRNGDRFDELLDTLLPGDATARNAAAALVGRLPPGGYGRWSLIVKCGECGVREAIPQLRAAFEETGKNRREIRGVSFFALARLLEGEERIQFITHAVDDRDPIVAEDAAIHLGASEDPSVVAPLLDWLEQRVRRPRSTRQARRTSEVIALCVRLGDADQHRRLQTMLGQIKLTDLEGWALDGNYRNQAFSPEFPQIWWPL